MNYNLIWWDRIIKKQRQNWGCSSKMKAMDMATNYRSKKKECVFQVKWSSQCLKRWRPWFNCLNRGICSDLLYLTSPSASGFCPCICLCTVTLLPAGMKCSCALFYLPSFLWKGNKHTQIIKRDGWTRTLAPWSVPIPIFGMIWMISLVNSRRKTCYLTFKG